MLIHREFISIARIWDGNCCQTQTHFSESKVEIKNDENDEFETDFEDLYKKGVRHVQKEKMVELAKKYEADYMSICLWFLQKEGVEI